MRLLFLLASALLLGGCVQTSDPSGTAEASRDAREGLAPLDLVGTGCREGGGHGVDPMGAWDLPEPWVSADVWEDVGPQYHYSNYVGPEVPEEGKTSGNWHAAVQCETMTFRGRAIEPFFAYVGHRIEKPVFDTSADEIDHHYLVTVVAVADEDLRQAFVAFGVVAMNGSATWDSLPGDHERILIATEKNGYYDAFLRFSPWGEPMRNTRLWLQNTGGELPHGAMGENPAIRSTPVSLDMRTDGGTHLVTPVPGRVQHWGSQHHGETEQDRLVAFPLTEAAGVANVGFDRTWSWGPRYADVVMERVWDH